MEITIEVPKPSSGRDQTHKGANMNHTVWQIVPMSDDPHQWKITDGSTNVADQFTSKEDAEQWVKWYVSRPRDSGEIELVYPAKSGGQKVENFAEVKRSDHGGDTRDSFHSDPKFFFKAVNAQIAGYFQTKLSDSDQFSIKILSGRHSDENEKAGRCYAIGLQINTNGPAKGHLAKELNHPVTPKFPNEIKYIGNEELPNVNDKTVGYRLTYYLTPQNTLKGRLDLDLSVMDKKPTELSSCPNQFKPYFEFEDDGDWEHSGKKGGEPYLQNNGDKHDNGDAMGMYVRIDKVTYETRSKFLQCVEITPPNQ